MSKYLSGYRLLFILGIVLALSTPLCSLTIVRIGGFWKGNIIERDTRLYLTRVVYSQNDVFELDIVETPALEGEYLLELAPEPFMQSIGLELSAGDTLYIRAIKRGGKLVVQNVYKEGLEFQLRDESGNILFEPEPVLSPYHVRADECIGCGLCIRKCPTDAISLVKGRAVIDQKLCIECGICIEGIGSFLGCPVGAIKK